MYEDIPFALFDCVDWTMEKMVQGTYDIYSPDEIRLVAPYGVEDLARLLVRPTPFYASGSAASVFQQRISEKKWQDTWPRLTVVNPRVSENRTGNGTGEPKYIEV